MINIQIEYQRYQMMSNQLLNDILKTGCWFNGRFCPMCPCL